MLNPLPVRVEREDLFVERYGRLFSWSLQMTEHDRELAEDLVHELFIQFTLNAPDPHTIKNLDGYLFTMLRNLYLTHRRRETRNTLQQLSIVEYDSAEVGLRTVHLRDQIRAQDDLRRICHYACARKETAKIASVLILRFFHGYYLEEIVRVLRSSRMLIDTWLKLARREVKTAVLSEADENRLEFISRRRIPQVLPTGYARSIDVFLEELRQTIFQNRQGKCLPDEALKHLYLSEPPTPIDCAQASHIVSCAPCLDQVNRLLGLPILAERSATETLGRDTRKRGGGGPDAGGTGGDGLTRSTLNKLRRKVKDTFGHKPLELCVSVNGYTLGSQRVSSERSELNLVVDQEVRLNFVEVFSEQKIRLLLMGIEDLPPEGPGEQGTRVELSDQRWLDLTLRLAGPSPTIQVVYLDPHFNESLATVADGDEGIYSVADKSATTSVGIDDEATTMAEAAGTAPVTEGALPAAFSPHTSLVSASKRFVRALTNSNLWSRPARVTALVALILIAAVLLVYRNPPTSTALATRLLKQAADAEAAIASNRDQVVHRTINVEEKTAAGELLARRKIEVWQSAARGVTARRIYDEQGRLIAGDWRRADGVQTLYHHGAPPKLQLAPEKRGPGAISSDTVWQLSPSARDFSLLVSNTEQARIEEKPSVYVISFDQGAGAAPKGLLKASLTLARTDLRATELTLLIRDASQNSIREYSFTEASFERHSPATVAPAVFEPDKEFLSSAKLETPNSKLETNSPLALAPSPVLATPALEVEVLRLLNQAGADLGEQINVTRTPAGTIRVEGLVESSRRKTEVLQALSSVKGNSAVSIQIETVNEALKKRPSQSSSISQNVESAELADRLPVDAELRRYFSARGASGEMLEQQIHSFATRIANRSQQMQAHAFALRNLANRFSAEDLRAMDPDAKRKWRSLIRAHAASLAKNAAALRRDLELVFPAAAATGDTPGGIADDGALVAVIGRLFALSSANDQSIQSAFNISARGAQAAGPKSAQFWRTLLSVERFANAIAGAQ